MRFMGIDYGSKRVGIALSDSEGMLAFPKIIFPNDKELMPNILAMISEEMVEGIVIGESIDHNGEENEIMKKISVFAQSLKEYVGVPVHFEREFMTSVFARQTMSDTGNIARKTKASKQEPVDDSAAAIILQRFLEKRNKGSLN
jgi:putative Holliday junction resolvase